MRLGYCIFYVAEVGETLAFYEAAFGLARRFLHESGAYGELETGATALAFASEAMAVMNGLDIVPNRPDAKPGGAEIALVTEDVAAAWDRAVAAGAAPVKPPLAKPWGQVVGYVRDNNGIVVELCSPMPG